MTATRSLVFTVTGGSTLVKTMTQSHAANNDNTYNMGPGGNDVGTASATPYMGVSNAADGGSSWSYSMGFYSDFPNHTTWTWRTSVASGGNTGSPLSYQELAYGGPNPGWFPVGKNPPTPLHPSDFAAAGVTLTFQLALNALGHASDIDWLIETWSCNTPTPVQGGSSAFESQVTNEIGFFTYAYPALLAYAQSGTHRFDATLSDGMNIRVYTVGGGTDKPYVNIFPVTAPGANTVVNLCDGQTHTVRFGEIIGLLASNGVMSNNDYIVGYDFGPETYAGSGHAVANVFSWNNWTFT